MSIPIYHLDAFASGPFTGNPAAVCLLEGPRDTAWMQNVAIDMNLSETAFLHPIDGGYSLRWFTPAVEVDLCGHATLASAHVLFETGRLKAGQLARFNTKSGWLECRRLSDGRIEMDFPATPAKSCDVPAGMLEALGIASGTVTRCKWDYLVEIDSDADVRALSPDHRTLRTLNVRGIIVTAKSSDTKYDFISRFFAPGSGVDEDPVTGSAHCALGPWWSGKLGKRELRAFQASRRGGAVGVRVAGERVFLGGHALTTLRGELLV